MTVLIGILVVFGCVIGGFLVSKGNLLVLLQPAEFMVIGGAAIGALIIGTPMHTIKQIGASIKASFSGKSGGAKIYMELLRVLYSFSSLVRKEGILALEKHIETPEESEVFKSIAYNNNLVAYLCDSLRLVVLGITPEELLEMLDADLETREAESHQPGDALNTTADSLPGLGIVAAVLGIIITMNSIGGEAAMVGKHVAAALVGTFLGVLLCYGLVGPLANVVKYERHIDLMLLKVARSGVISLSLGTNPLMVCEAARRSIPEAYRPEFKVMEDTLRGK